MGYSPEAKLVLPHVAGQSEFGSSLRSQLDGVMSFARQLPDEDVNLNPSSVEKMEKAVTELVTTVESGTPMAASVNQIKDLIQNTMLKKVEKTH